MVDSCKIIGFCKPGSCTRDIEKLPPPSPTCDPARRSQALLAWLPNEAERPGNESYELIPRSFGPHVL